MRTARQLSAFLWLACALSFSAASQQTTSPAQTAPPPRTVPPADAPNKPICAGCHEDKWTSIAISAHGAKNDAQGSMCQVCHGDASEHIKDPTKAKPANPFSHLKPASATDQSNVCLACHVGSRQLTFWESGKHAKQDVTCANCHSIHGRAKNPTVAPYTTSFRPNEAEICGTCHQQIRSAVMKPSHHPIIENKMKCSDCHNPHGALSPVMLRNETVNAQCTSCHADKRGPWVFSHPPVDENCLSCHNPHGSVHYALLNEHVPNLCQDCHDWSRHPGTFYQGQSGWLTPQGAPNSSPSTRLVSRSCLNCHNSIHGSNAPANRGQFLTR